MSRNDSICDELHRRGLLSSQEVSEYKATLTSVASIPKPIHDHISSLLLQDIDATIENVRVQSNDLAATSLDTSNLAALAVGGALGALSAWMRPTATSTTVWANAYDGAVATFNVAKRKRHLEQIQLQLLSGDIATCRHVVFCINGFMTQRDDPTRTWRVWTQEDTAIFAVQWEAGDATAWNEFCTHINDKFDSSSNLPAMLAHFAGNPWHNAQAKAEQVGVLLAHVLAERPALLQGRPISLFGHSLGGAAVYSTFQELAKLRAQERETAVPLIANAVSFAGAFLSDAQGLLNISNGLDPKGGKFINVFSSRDGVLSKLFWALHLPQSPIVAGCQSLTFTAANCVNIEVSDLVIPRVETHFGHSYGQFMEMIKSRVLPHLFRS
ncbi:hypothetical protein PsorP6_007337 [Peronosclerospora sorghi]|uniref:Uncharacterized protein n=1 Tax=Peronosclerospora sorghi TaxID=230839 RepID=A0ACC0W621_9STRA|nr:hypothetical protein PsorP6_007337 [Peronosclerospora sorghi]